MKKIFMYLLASCIAFTFFTSCNVSVTPPDDSETTEITKEQEPDGNSLEDMQTKISDSGSQLGVAYLGYDETAFDVQSYLDDLGIYELYPFAEDIDEDYIFSTDCNELYLIVPADTETDVRIYEAVLNEETFDLEKGELLGESVGGSPFLLFCNISEIMPNVILSTDYFDYSPCTSGMDGSLVTAEGIYDITPYANINEYFDIQIGAFDGADPIYCGSWFCEAEDGDGELMVMYLDLFTDGSAEYVYGIGNSEPIEWFSGEWIYNSENDTILLDMFGGPPNDDPESDALYTDPYDAQMEFSWDMDYSDDNTYLVLTHEDGLPLLYGTDGDTFEFIQIVDDYAQSYSYLYGSWCISSEYIDVYLELFENDELHYYVYEDGETIADLIGSWYALDNTLYLTLYDEYEDKEYSGEYELEYDGELLTLFMEDGSYALTDYMAENGYDSFMISGLG